MSTAVATTVPNTLQEVLAHFNISELQIKQIGIRLMIAQLAAEEPGRLRRLIEYRNAAEEKLFDPKILPHLSYDEIVSRYQLVVAAENNSYTQIQRLTNDVNLEDIKTNMQILQQSIGSEVISAEDLQADASANDIANKLLARMSVIHKSSDRDEE